MPQAMIAAQLKAIFDPYIQLNQAVWENFSKLGTVVSFPQETILKKAHATEKHLNIVLQGSGGNLIWNRNNFVCIDIAFERDFLFDFMSFTLQKPTPIEVRLFEDTTLFQMSYTHFQMTLTQGHFGQQISRLVAEASFIDKQQQQIDLLTMTAKARYIQLVQTRQGIERTPLKYLASYLGITPQSLSRIRAEKL